jgi:hypothetical protein
VDPFPEPLEGQSLLGDSQVLGDEDCSLAGHGQIITPGANGGVV